MRKYHIFEALFLSFYSKPLYQDVGRSWKGLGLVYLLLVLAICWLPFSYDFHRFLNQFSAEILPDIIRQFPTVTYSHGELSIDKPVPYFIKQPANGVTLIVFDTSGQYTSLKDLNSYTLVTRDKIFIRDFSQPQKVTSYLLSKLQIPEGKMDHAQLMEFSDRFILMSSVLMYPVSVAISFLVRLIQALAFGLIALLLAGLYKIEMNYKTAVRLSVVALTPMLFLSTLAEYLSWPIPFLSGAAALLALGYLVFAVRSQKL